MKKKKKCCAAQQKISQQNLGAKDSCFAGDFTLSQLFPSCVNLVFICKESRSSTLIVSEMNPIFASLMLHRAKSYKVGQSTDALQKHTLS